MSVMMLLKIQGGTLEQYDQATKEVFDGTLTPSILPEGLLSHVCVKTDDGIKVIDVWESQANFEAFGAKLAPALQRAHISETQPKYYEVHNFFKA
jgi:hypothetical protein